MKTISKMLLIALLPCGMHAAETLSPEMILPIHAAKDAFTPCVAYGQGSYMVVWQSGRLGEGDLSKKLVMSSAIVACRVGKDGAPLDATPLVVSGAADLRERPQAAFGGKVFLVVWQDLRNAMDWDVHAARVSPEGKCLDPDGILVSGGKHNQCLPRVTWDGKDFQVVWQDWRSGNRYEVFGARVSPEGKVLEPRGESLATDAKLQRYAPALASAGTGKSLLLWLCSAGPQGGTAAGGEFLVDGKPAGPPVYSYTPEGNWATGHGPGGSCWFVCLSAGPKGYLSGWRNYSPSGRGDGAGGSNAAFFDMEGRRTKNLFLSGKSQRILDPDIAWDGAGFAAAWHVYARDGKGCPYEVVQAARVSADGEPTGQPHAVAGSFESPAKSAAVASAGDGKSLIAYEKHPEKAEVPIRIACRILSAEQ